MKYRGTTMVLFLKKIMIAGIFILMSVKGGLTVKAESLTLEDLSENWVQPVEGVITDTFGTRKGKHKGIDIAAPNGEAIRSVSAGVVTKSYYSDSYGHVVFIKHPEGYETVYAHLHKRFVTEGETVKKGESVGIIGNTGISTGTHLHFEVHKGEWTIEKKYALDPIFMFHSTEYKTALSN